MKIIIDTEKRTIEVPSEFKEAYEGQAKMNKMLGKEKESIISNLDISDYRIVSKQARKVLDKTNSKTIADYMEKVKDTKKDLYEEYINLKNKVVKTTATGKEVKTNFLVIKKWFYDNFPSENPFNK